MEYAAENNQIFSEVRFMGHLKIYYKHNLQKENSHFQNFN